MSESDSTTPALTDKPAKRASHTLSSRSSAVPEAAGQRSFEASCTIAAGGPTPMAPLSNPASWTTDPSRNTRPAANSSSPNLGRAARG